MSFEPDSEEIKVRQIREEVRQLRTERNIFSEGAEISNNTDVMGNSTGQGSMNHGVFGDIIQGVTNVIDGIAAGVNSIDVSGAFETITAAAGEGTDAIVNYINSEIEGLSVLFRPKAGQTLCFVANATPNASIQGNIMLDADLTLTDTQVAKFKFQNDKQYADDEGGWVLESTTNASGGSSSTPLYLKLPSRAATTGNDYANLGSVPTSLDGLTLDEGDRVLVKDQTIKAQNGIYVVGVVSGGFAPLTRATDFDSVAEIRDTALLPITSGTINADKYFQVQNDITTLGSSSIFIIAHAGGEVFTWTDDHDADGNNLLNVATFRSAAANIAGAGTIRLSFDEFIAYSDVTTLLNSTFRFDSLNRWEFNTNGVRSLTIDQDNLNIDFEQNKLSRVSDINAFTGDHEIGNVDPFHKVHARGFVPTHDDFSFGSLGEFKRNKGALFNSQYMDLINDGPIEGVFDIRRAGLGREFNFVADSDPWFRFKVTNLAVPDFQIFHNGGNPATIRIGQGSEQGSLQYDPSGDLFLIDHAGATDSKGTVLTTNGLLQLGIFDGVDNANVKLFTDIDMLAQSMINIDDLRFHVTSGTAQEIRASLDGGTINFHMNGVDYVSFNDGTGGDPLFQDDGIITVHGDRATFKVNSRISNPTNNPVGQIMFDAEDSFATQITYGLVKFTVISSVNNQEEGQYAFELRDGTASNVTRPMVVIETDLIRGASQNTLNLGNATYPMADITTRELHLDRGGSAIFDVYGAAGSGDDRLISRKEIRADVNTATVTTFGKTIGKEDWVLETDANSGTSYFDIIPTWASSSYVAMRVGGDEITTKFYIQLDMNDQSIMFSVPRSMTGINVPTGRWLFSDTNNNDELSVKLPNGTIVSLEGAGGGGVDLGANYSWTGIHTFGGNATSINSPFISLGDNTSDNVAFGGRVASDFIPNSDNSWILGYGGDGSVGSERRWAGIFSTKFRLDRSERYFALTSGVHFDIVLNSPSLEQGDIRFFVNSTFTPQLSLHETDAGGYHFIVRGGSRFRSSSGTEIGYFVTNWSSGKFGDGQGSVGNKGSMQFPYLVSGIKRTGGIASSVLDQEFGRATGCQGVQYDSGESMGSGRYRHWVKFASSSLNQGVWVFTELGSAVTQPNI